MFVALLFVITSSSLLSQVFPARILAVFPMPSISHQVVFRPLTQELAKRGHEVVVVTPDPAFPKGQTPPRLTEIDVHDISYNLWKRFVSAAAENNNDLFIQLEVAFDLILDIFKTQLEVKEIKEILNNKKNKFDLLLLEACIMPALSLAHVYDVPVIQISSFGGIVGNYELFGTPNHPIFYPLPLRQKIYNLTMWEKVVELYYNHYKLNKLTDKFELECDKVLTKIFGSNFPGLSKLKNNVHMLFLNIHSIWDNNRPVPQNVIYLGGLHQKPYKELPHNLSSLLDVSEHGVIYFSLGTNVDPSLLPPEKIKTIIKVFSKLPYDILWKWHSNMSFNMPDNVKIRKWFPQSDLLRHPKIKLFITQGGLQSTDEAITAGVPLIGIPMLGDQWFNVEQYVHHGIGVRLDFETLSEETLSNAIKTVIENESYRQNMARFRSIVHDQQETPLQRAVWWTEYVLRHSGAAHLRTPAANLTWIQYYQVELVIVLLASLIIAIALFIIMIRVTYYYLMMILFQNKQKHKNKIGNGKLKLK
ncbi:UDP-glucosyltransferase 2-like [Battus philenor]|uniref:UDP-glucosyltransferase 2-like n=1 Tax=Battus philenor TaxID=42288 RepID=UPI0035CE8759